MAKELGVPLYTIYSERQRVLRYVSSAVRTLRILRQQRPEVVICQNPSIVLNLWLLLLRPIMGFRLVVDAHYGGILACTGSTLVQRVLDSISRTANLVIVTNDGHAGHVRALGGTPFICPDPLPDLSAHRRDEAIVHKKVFFTCSFDIDEPYGEALTAASTLSAEGFQCSISGNFRRAGVDPCEYPQIRFLGFVPEAEYYRQLFSSELVADLTNYEDCLVCGAYEAMAACKPTVLSRTSALQQYFTGGAVFTENRASAIAQAVREAYAKRASLQQAGREWTDEATRQMKERLALLLRTIEGL